MRVKQSLGIERDDLPISARNAGPDIALTVKIAAPARSASSWVLSVSRVTTPKLPPPPPFSAQSRSGLVQALAMRTAPSAVTTSASSSDAAAVP
jgi:hypothetical protein